MDIFQYLNRLDFIILCCFVIAWLIQMAYIWGLFSRLAFYKNKNIDSKKGTYEPVSVIVCSRDSYSYLKELVPTILSQDYSEFELVIVNDCSQDETSAYLKRLLIEHPEVNVVTLSQSLNFFKGKKFPLSMGIKSAKYDLLLLTDADCKPNNDQWIKGMMSAYNNDKIEIVVGYGPYAKRKGLLNKLIRFDTLYTAIQYLSMALAKKTYMGVGRNLSYRRTTFYKNKGFTSHYTIPSGDDDLFISQVATKNNTNVFIDPNIRVESHPKRSWSEWIHQKRRHYSTANMYKPFTSFVLGNLLLNRLFYYILLPFLFILPFSCIFNDNILYYYIFISLLLIIHYTSMVMIYVKSAKNLGEKKLFLAFSPFYDFFFVIFTTLLGLRNKISKPKGW